MACTVLCWGNPYLKLSVFLRDTYTPPLMPKFTYKPHETHNNPQCCGLLWVSCGNTVGKPKIRYVSGRADG